MPSDPSRPVASDRNLLFGILALQMDFIDRDALVAAMNAWVLDKSKSLGQILSAQGVLRKEDRDLLDVLIQRHLQMHGDDVERSLASLGSVESLREDLHKVVDPDLQASLALVPGRAPPKDDPYVTRPSSAGQSSVPGMRYRILHEHAKGGLGAVYLAQDEELHRQVALKEIQEKYAHHTESQSRFLLEAEVTGGLEHPGIVPVYGLGRYPDGRPFYAMRFIRGDSLHEAIRRFYAADEEKRDPGERSLAFRELLRQFVAACNALAYAHARGVLHRDVKPRNIMLGKFGETLVVDWGLAKVTGDRDGQSKSEEGALLPSVSGESTPTQAGHVMGTPAYMSPEQAEGRLDRLGPASDIYSLGATLYEILTSQQSIQGQHLGELLSRVKRGDWLPPRKIRKDVPAALDAITRKALALRPEDRYPTALQLAGDVEHWLADEPVTAYREPWSGRLRRWVRRHRGLAAGVAGLLITTVAALAVGIVAVNHQKNLTELERQRTREALDKMTSGAIDGWLTRQKGDLEPAQKQYLKEALTYYQEFARKSGDSEEIRSGVADAHRRVGDMASRLGQRKEAEEAYRGAVARYEQLAAEFPKNTDYRRALAKGYNNLGNLLVSTGKTAEAEKVFREGVAIQKQLTDEITAAPVYAQDLATSHNNLGVLLWGAGRTTEAEKEYRDALAIHQQLVERFPDEPSYRKESAGSQNNLGLLLKDMGRSGEAENAYRAALAIYEQLVAKFPNVANYRHELATTHHNLGELLLSTSRLPEAEKPLREALALCRQLVNEFPAVPRYRQELAATYDHLGTLLKETGQLKAAEEAGRDALAICKRLVDEFKDIPEYRQQLARSYNNLGVLLAVAGAPKEAEQAYRDALDLRKQLADKFPDVPDYHNLLANTMVNLAELLRDRKDYRQARELLEDARPHHEAASKANALNPTYQRYFRNNLVVLASTWAGSGDQGRARATAAQLAALGWNAARDAYAAACALAQCARVLQNDSGTPESKSQELAAAYIDRALSMLRQAIGSGYKDAAHMKQDKDLDPLRGHAEFQKLLNELEAGGAGK